jgi:hypothetical protein
MKHSLVRRGQRADLQASGAGAGATGQSKNEGTRIGGDEWRRPVFFFALQAVTGPAFL